MNDDDEDDFSCKTTQTDDIEFHVNSSIAICLWWDE